MEQKTSTIDSMIWAWSVVALGLMLTGYAIYLTFIVEELVSPNSTSWSLWALGGAIEAWTYWKLVTSTKSGNRRSSELALALPAIACAILAVLLAGVSITLGRFGWPDPWEWVVAVIDVSVVFTYIIIKSLTGETSKAAKWASALMVIDIILSFIPIWVATAQNPGNESVIPWTIWSCSYALVGFAAFLQLDKSWKDRAWLFLYPAISTFTHGLVAILASRGGI